MDKLKRSTACIDVHTLDTMHALCLPLGASASLLVMFFFFDSMQLLFAICTAVIATVALAFLLLPMCQYMIASCSDWLKVIRLTDPSNSHDTPADGRNR
ncbi:Signal peptide peptidase-like 3 [Amphibalanus amphitrite]|uniref:Signal peptide peptidase-like 3 n=1 Tax=Amphibalanus amphitrite TaxID=1232801 RepID=A0A6A4VZS2_AMPAM|nr:Signal peptide peptidase-like 3 [Amphibalanus amphitrite]